MANQSKKALNEVILEVAGVPRKPMTPVEKLKLARQHKGKAIASTTASTAKTIATHFPPSPHVTEEKRLSPPRSPPIIIMDEPLRV